MKKFLPYFAVLFFSLAASLIAPAIAGERPGIDALSDSAAAKSKAKVAPRKSKLAFARADIVSRMHVEERLDVPSFVWFKEGTDLARAKARSAMTPEDAARAQLRDIADLYRMSLAEIDAAPMTTAERVFEGYLVKFSNERDGIEIFRDGVAVMMNSQMRAIAVGGSIGNTGSIPSLAKVAGSPFRLSAAEAIAYAMTDYGFSPSVAASLSFRGSKAASAKVAKNSVYQYYGLPGVASSTGAYLAQPARAKAVWFRLNDGLVPGYYVETQMYEPVSKDIEYYGYVISAEDGSMLFRNFQQNDLAFTYKTYAETGGINTPFVGPQGRGGTPHPTGLNDGFQAPFVPQNDLTLQNGPISTNDPWLPPAATRTIGNNVEAWANLFGPAPVPPATDPLDGTFDPDPNECDMLAPYGAAIGDFHACLSGPASFQYTFDPTVAAQATKTQIVAATVNLFYMNNWLHDFWYDAGFKEIDGNAQDSNYGRGGLEADSIRAQAQDYSGTDNANMSTPADGARPRMRMYVFNGLGGAAMTINSPAPIARTTATVGVALAFGAQTFDLTTDVVAALDAADAAGPLTTDGCSAITNGAAIAGKIAFVDRGTCGFAVKALNVQNAGAAGLLIANTAAGAFGNLGGADPTVTIPVFLVTFTDGNDIRANLAAPVNVRMQRVVGVRRDGTVDNSIIAHEWGHYISNRLVVNASGLSTNMSRGMGEGWGDFTALMMMVKEEDALVPSNANFNGVYGEAGYVSDGPTIPGVTQSTGYYNGIRRYPYSSNLAKNPLTYRHTANNQALPVSPPPAFDGTHAEVHNSGEVWASMLWQCYSNILRETLGATPRLTFAQAQARMKAYIVAGYKLTPAAPTFVEARDGIYAAMAANDLADLNSCAAGFATRGAGFGAVSPVRTSTTNNGVVESFVVSGNNLAITSSTLNTTALFCDADPYLDNGEIVQVAVTVKNTGLAVLTGATVTITSPTTGITFPSGPTVLTGDIAPFASATVMVPVGIVGAVNLSTASLTATVTHPSVTPTPPASTITIKTQRDDVADSSATDNVEAESTVWTKSLVGTTNPALNWVRTEFSQTDHKWRGPTASAGGIGYLTSPALVVGPTGPFSITFTHRYTFEFDAGGNYDGGIIEVSDDDGATWADIETIIPNVYNGTILIYPDDQNPAAGRRGFVMTSAGYPAMLAPVTLTFPPSFLGKTVRIRFGASSDESVAFAGWDVDDITVAGITNTPFFTLAGDAGACTISANAGSPQSAAIGAAFATPLKALAQKLGAPLSGLNVTFTAPSSGASGTFTGGGLTATVVTDAGGFATAPTFTANSTLGTYNVIAAVGLLPVNFALTNVTPSFLLTATVAGTGTGTITSNPAGITCPGDCTESYVSGTSVDLTAAADAGSAFVSWTGCDSVVNNVCTISVVAAATVTANFTALTTYNVVMEGYQQSPYVITPATGGGTVVYNPANHTLTLSITYSGLTGTETMAHIHGNAGRGANAGVLINLSAGSPKNDVVVLSAPQEASLLAGTLYINVHTTTFGSGEIRGQIDNLGATVLRTLTVTTTGTGTGTVGGTVEAGTLTVIDCGSDCTEAIPHGKVATLTATATAGSTFTGWSGACIGTNACLVTMDAAKTATANFDITPADTTPDAFTFTDQTNVTPGTVITSNAITVAGIDAAAAISVTGGSYSVGCTGTFVTAAGTVINGNTVCVRHTAPLAFTAATNTVLTIGGVSDTFTSTTGTTLPVGGDADNDGIPNEVEPTELRNPLVKDNDVFGVARLFVMQQYRDFLGREGDAAGIQFYVDLLNAGTLIRGQVIQNFFNSPEFQGVGSPIARLYFATFLRTPDYPGLVFQINAARSGASLTDIANNFTVSPEFANTYGSLNNAQFVALLYTNILGRAASQAEIDYHVARLTGGATRGEVLLGFSESPEYQASINNEVFVTLMYTGMIKRAPEPAGLTYWVNYIEAGNPGINLILGFLNAPEYHDRFLP